MSRTPLVAWSFELPSAGGDAAVDDDRALPVRIADRQRRRRCLPGRRRVDVDPAAPLDVEEAAGEHRARAAVAVRPDLVQAAALRAARRPCRAEVARNTQVPCQVAGSEKRSVGPGTGTVCSSPPVVGVRRRRASRAAAAAAGRPCRPGRSSRPRAAPARSSRDRGRCGSARPGSPASSASAAASPSGESTSDAVAPVRLAVEGAVAGRDEQVAGRRVDDRRRAAPDRRVARRARRGLDDPVPVRAERVPDADDAGRSPG